MGTKQLKPVKVQLNSGGAGGMYILLTADEVKLTKAGETAPPNRIYKIEVAVEATHNSKRCRGKSTFTIPKGTSISKAVAGLLGKREEMKDILKSKGTLKVEKKTFKKVDTKDRKLSSVFEAWISGKNINQSANTIRIYNSCYSTHLTKLKNKVIDDIVEDDIQNVINTMINAGKSPSTINVVKMVLKPLLELNDIQLNWKKIILPKNDKKRTFDGTDDEARTITTALLNYKHPVAKSIFAFLLTGRRIGETLLMEHKHINYTPAKAYPYGSFTLPAENTKTNTTVTYGLTPALINIIKAQKTTTGKVFALKRDAVNYHFHKCMNAINVHGMVMHDIRSMVAVVALRNGADIYSVSKMLSHKKLATTEARYLGNGTEVAVEAQDTFTAVAGAPNDVIDVDVVDDEFTALKAIYPGATDDAIHQVMEMMK